MLKLSLKFILKNKFRFFLIVVIVALSSSLIYFINVVKSGVMDEATSSIEDVFQNFDVAVIQNSEEEPPYTLKYTSVNYINEYNYNFFSYQYCYSEDYNKIYNLSLMEENSFSNDRLEMVVSNKFLSVFDLKIGDSYYLDYNEDYEVIIIDSFDAIDLEAINVNAYIFINKRLNDVIKNELHYEFSFYKFYNYDVNDAFIDTYFHGNSQIISKNQILSDYKADFQGVLYFMNILQYLVIILAIFIVLFTYNIVEEERSKTIAVLRSIGINKVLVLEMLFIEGLLTFIVSLPFTLILMLFSSKIIPIIFNYDFNLMFNLEFCLNSLAIMFITIVIVSMIPLKRVYNADIMSQVKKTKKLNKVMLIIEIIIGVLLIAQYIFVRNSKDMLIGLGLTKSIEIISFVLLMVVFVIIGKYIFLGILYLLKTISFIPKVKFFLNNILSYKHYFVSSLSIITLLLVTIFILGNAKASSYKSAEATLQNNFSSDLIFMSTNENNLTPILETTEIEFNERYYAFNMPQLITIEFADLDTLKKRDYVYLKGNSDLVDVDLTPIYEQIDKDPNSLDEDMIADLVFPVVASTQAIERVNSLSEKNENGEYLLEIPRWGKVRFKIVAEIEDFYLVSNQIFIMDYDFVRIISALEESTQNLKVCYGFNVENRNNIDYYLDTVRDLRLNHKSISLKNNVKTINHYLLKVENSFAYIDIIIYILLISSCLILNNIFIVTNKMRKKEYQLLRSIGASKNKIIIDSIIESLIVSVFVIIYSKLIIGFYMSDLMLIAGENFPYNIKYFKGAFNENIIIIVYFVLNIILNIILAYIVNSNIQVSNLKEE